jgi:hypothetical protein
LQFQLRKRKQQIRDIGKNAVIADIKRWTAARLAAV